MLVKLPELFLAPAVTHTDQHDGDGVGDACEKSGDGGSDGANGGLAAASRSDSPNPAACAAHHPAPGMTDASVDLQPAGRTASPPAAGGKCRLGCMAMAC
jgi:hypothetical protein